MLLCSPQVEQYAEINGEYSLPPEATPPVPASVIQVPASSTADAVGGGAKVEGGPVAEQPISIEENPRTDGGKGEEPSGPIPNSDSTSKAPHSPKPDTGEPIQPEGGAVKEAELVPVGGEVDKEGAEPMEVGEEKAAVPMETEGEEARERNGACAESSETTAPAEGTVSMAVNYSH